MRNMEAALKDMREELDGIKAPDEMEARLRQALEGRRPRAGHIKLAVILAAVIFFTYNFDVLAYYGKKFTGYEQITVGSLRQLNEEGRGQAIGKTCAFSNGVEVTVDGIMFDENQLVVFYRVHARQGKIQDVLDYNLPRLHLYGIKPGGYFFSGGQGNITDDRSMSFVDTLQPPQFYEKWMRFDIQLVIGGKAEARSIAFTLERNKAMGRTARKELKAEAKLGNYSILFDRLTASAMSSVIEGRIMPLTEEAFKAFRPEPAELGFEVPRLIFDIVSDKGEVCRFYSEQGVSNTEISFKSRSDALPKNFNTLQIRNIRFETLKLADKTVNIGEAAQDIQIADDMVLKRLYQDDGNTLAVVSSRGIPVMGLFEGERQLEQADSSELDMAAESTVPVERTYKFYGTGKDLKLMVKYIRYNRYSSDNIAIPAG